MSTLPKGEYEAEIKRREDEAAAKQKTEDDAVAAEAAEQQRLANEAAQQDADQKAAADKAVAEKAAADAAEQEKQLAEKARIAEEAAHPKTKIVKEYQVRDEEGNPMGAPRIWKQIRGKRCPRSSKPRMRMRFVMPSA